MRAGWESLRTDSNPARDSPHSEASRNLWLRFESGPALYDQLFTLPPHVTYDDLFSYIPNKKNYLTRLATDESCERAP